MKNGINTGQFHVKTGFLGNGRRKLISTSVNTETGSHKYGNRQTKIKNKKRSEQEYFRPFSTLLLCSYDPHGSQIQVVFHSLVPFDFQIHIIVQTFILKKQHLHVYLFAES